jgi:hypothetical protein
LTEEIVQLRRHESSRLSSLSRVQSMKQLRRVLPSALYTLLQFCLPFTV